MHIPNRVSSEGAKIFLSYATAVAGLGLTVKLARDSIRDNGGALALALRSLIASVLVFGFRRSCHPVGVSECT